MGRDFELFGLLREDLCPRQLTDDPGGNKSGETADDACEDLGEGSHRERSMSLGADGGHLDATVGVVDEFGQFWWRDCPGAYGVDKLSDFSGELKYFYRIGA
jgi:hypothetical protein